MGIRASMVLWLALTSLTVLAAESPMEQEMAAIRTYCKSDVERLCPGLEPGGGRIKACLKTHENEISVGCAKALQKLKKTQE